MNVLFRPLPTPYRGARSIEPSDPLLQVYAKLTDEQYALLEYLMRGPERGLTRNVLLE